MKNQCKVYDFPTPSILDTGRNAERCERALFNAIEKKAGRGTLETLKPLINAYRASCDLNGYADGIAFMENRYKRATV